MSIRRFRVSGHSMTPTLQPGQEIVATNTTPPVQGDLVVFEHPDREGFWLVKRLVDETGYVLSDNKELGGDDSRSLGPLPLDHLHRVVDQLDATTFGQASALLAGEDESLARALDTYGMPEFWHRQPGLRTLVWLILEQQVSLESGAAMYQRLDQATAGISARSISDLGVDAMRSIGVTRQKAGYLADLANLILDGAIDLDAFTASQWEQARTSLLDVKGIGPWTADAYLLSALRVPDMWPVGDRALQVGAAEVLGMTTVPDEAELEMIGETWRPIRAVAARIIWHAYLSKRGRVEPADPTIQSK